MRNAVKENMVPVMIPGARTMANKRRALNPEEEGINDSMIGGLLGEGNLFPDDAKEFTAPADSRNQAQTQPIGEPSLSKPEFPTYPGEPLISPAVALVAPDVTPDALLPIDPSEVPPNVSLSVAPVAAPPAPAVGPAADPVLRTLMGRPALPVPESVPTLSLPGIDSAPSVALGESGVVSTGYNVVAAAMSAGTPMPEHTVNPNGTKRVMETFRKIQRL